MQRRSVVLGLLGAVLLGYAAWRTWWPGDEQRIERRLQALASDVNESTTDGLGTVARAAKIGSYFTDDVVVELGKGAPPIQGRETLMAMATRLQPRTAAFTLKLLDLHIDVRDGSTAQVNLTAAFERRGPPLADDTLDARELLVDMIHRDGDWRINRVKTVEAFR